MALTKGERTYAHGEIQPEDFGKVRPVAHIRSGVDFEHVHSLATSMKEEGQKQPVVVYTAIDPETKEEYYALTSGEHRFEAVKKAKTGDPLKVYFTEPMTETEIVIDALVENMQREMTPIDMINAHHATKQALIGEGKQGTDKEVGELLKKLGYSTLTSAAEISFLRRIGGFCTEDTKKMLHKGEVSLGFVRLLLKKKYNLTAEMIEFYCKEVRAGDMAIGKITAKLEQDLKDEKADKEWEKKQKEREKKKNESNSPPKPKSEPQEGDDDEEYNPTSDNDDAPDPTVEDKTSIGFSPATLSMLLFHQYEGPEETREKVLLAKEYLEGEEGYIHVPSSIEKEWLLDTLIGYRSFDDLVEFFRAGSRDPRDAEQEEAIREFLENGKEIAGEEEK
jgi:ParB-like chromosome segregation protein Spo0J